MSIMLNHGNARNTLFYKGKQGASYTFARRFSAHFALIVALSVVFSLFLAFAVMKPTLVGATEYTETPIGFDGTKHLPAVDPDIGDGTALTADPNAIVPISGLSANASSALVRVSVSEPNADISVFSGGADILELSGKIHASTTFLAPIINGGVNIYANAPVSARIEVVSSFEAKPNVPGSVIAIPKAVRRADTMLDLGGKALTKEGNPIGVVGLGGVPKENVRTIFYTATIRTDAPSSIFEIGNHKIPIPYKGITHISDIAVPDDAGNVYARVYRDDGQADTSAQLTFDVRGYVVEAKPDSSAINSFGSFVPRLNNDPITVSAEKADTSVKFDVPTTSSDSEYSLFMVSATANTDRPTTLDIGDDTLEREQGVFIDPEIGAYPQLVMAKVKDKATNLTIHHGSADVDIWHIGDIIGSVSSDDNSNQSDYKNLDMAITAPTNNAKINYKDEKTLSIKGTITESNNSLAVMNVWSDYNGGFNIGGVKTRYTENGVDWSIDMHPPSSGHYTFTITATDRTGAKVTKQVSVEVEMFDEVNEQGILYWPKTVQIDDASRYKQINKDNVIMDCDDNIKAGSVIISLMTPETPKGLIRNVVAVDRMALGCKYTTEDGDMSDAAQWMNIQDNSDVTNSLGQDTLDKIANTKILNDDGTPMEGASIENVKLIDENDADIRHGDEMSGNGSDKVDNCTPDMQPLTPDSTCDMQIEDNDYTKSAKVPAEYLPNDNADEPNAGTNAVQQGYRIPDNVNQQNSEKASKAVNNVIGANSTSFTPSKQQAPIFALTKYQENIQNNTYSDIASGMKKKDGSGGKALHFETSFTVRLNCGSASCTILGGTGSTMHKPNQPAGPNVPAGDGSDSDEDESDSKKSGMDTDVIGTIKIVIKYEKDIKIYSDAGSSFRIWFPSWHFWDIHIDLDAHAIVTTEQTTKLTIEFDVIAEVKWKKSLFQIEVPIIPGIISFVMDIGFYLKLSLEAQGGFIKTTYDYKQSGIRIHNFSSHKVEDTKSESKSSTVGYGKIIASFEVGVTLSPQIRIIGIIFVGVAITVGVQFNLSISFFHPPGTENTYANGEFGINFIISASLVYGLDFRIFKIQGSFNLINISIPLYKVTFSPKIPKTLVGQLKIQTGITNSTDTNYNAYRDSISKLSNKPVFMVLSKTVNSYMPIIIATNKSVDYGMVDQVDSNFVWQNEDWRSKWWKKNIYDEWNTNSEKDYRNLPTTTNGLDSVAYLSGGDPLSLRNTAGAFKNDVITPELVAEYGMYMNQDWRTDYTTGTDLLFADTLAAVKGDENVPKAAKSMQSLSQMGFVAPDDDGNIQLDFLAPGDYKVIPVYLPPGVATNEKDYSFNIPDWSSGDFNNWDGKTRTAELGINLNFDASYTVKDYLRNTSRSQDFTETGGESILVAPGDVVESKVTVDYPASNANNLGALTSPQLLYDLSDNSGDGSLIFDQAEIDRQFNLCTIMQETTRIFGPSENTCEIKMQGTVSKAGYFSAKPTLKFSNAPLTDYAKGSLYINSKIANDQSFKASDVPADPAGSAPQYTETPKVNGIPFEAFTTRLHFQNMQKYTFPIVYLDNVQYKLVKGAEAISSLSSDLTLPYAGNGQVQECGSAGSSGTSPPNSACIFSKTVSENGSESDSKAGGLIDIYYLAPGIYHLSQMSAPKHYKQTGVEIEFEIVKPSKNAPATGDNDQGMVVIPPEIYVETGTSVDSATNAQKLSDTAREFPAQDNGLPSAFTGTRTDYLGAPNDITSPTFTLSYPQCANPNDDNCNIAPAGRPYLTTSRSPDDIISQNPANPYRVSEMLVKDGTPIDQTALGQMVSDKYSADSTLTPTIGELQCVAIPNPVDASGNATNSGNGTGCENSPQASGVHFEQIRMLLPASSYQMSTDYIETLEKNQTVELELSLDSDEGTPSKGILNAIRYNRGFGGIFVKEKNSAPFNGDILGLTAGIGIAGATIALFNENGTQIGSDQQTLDSSYTISGALGKYTANDIASDSRGTALFEHLQAGNYYLQVKSVPQGYTLNADAKYPFTVKYQRTVSSKPKGNVGGSQNAMLVENGWYNTNTAFADYTPKFTYTSTVRNVTRDISAQTFRDVAVKAGDVIEYTADVKYDESENVGVAYNPVISWELTDNLTPAEGFVNGQNFGKTYPWQTDAVKDEGRKGFIPGDTASFKFRAVAENNELANITANIYTEYDTADHTVSAEFTPTMLYDKTITIDSTKNYEYPGHIDLTVGERWAVNRVIPNVPFKLVQNGAELPLEDISSLPSNKHSIVSPTVNDNTVYTDSFGHLQLDYLEAGNYTLIPDTANPKWPEGYILGPNDPNAYANDATVNDGAYSGDQTKIDFTISDYKVENPQINLNLGYFTLYYQPQITTELTQKNITRSPASDYSENVVVKPQDVVEYKYTAKYEPSYPHQKGLLHSPKLALHSNSPNNFTLDDTTLNLTVDGHPFGENVPEGPVNWNADTGTVTLPNNLEPGATIELTYRATIGKTDEVTAWVEFQFDHKYREQQFPYSHSSAYRQSLFTTTTEQHSLATIFLSDAEIGLYNENGQSISIVNSPQPDRVYSEKASESGTVISRDDGEGMPVDPPPGLSPDEFANYQKGMNLAQNAIVLDYLEPGNYYFKQVRAPIGYDLSPEEQFKFTIPKFDEAQYIQGERGQETNVDDLINANAELARTYSVANDNHTIWFDYTPQLKMTTTVRNFTRQGTDFGEKAILKPGDEADILVKIEYPKDDDPVAKSEGWHNRGIVYGANINDAIHNSEGVGVSSDGGKTFADLDSWNANSYEFGALADKSIQDNDGKRMSPGDTYYLTYREKYVEEKVIREDIALHRLYENKSLTQKATSNYAQSSTPLTAATLQYFGRVNFSAFEIELDKSQKDLQGVEFALYKQVNDGNDIKVGTSKTESIKDLAFGDNATDVNGNGQLEYIDDGDYYFKIAKVPTGNLLDPDTKYPFTQPLTTLTTPEDAKLAQTLDSTEIGVRRIDFKALTSENNAPLSDTTIQVLTAEGQRIAGIVSPEANPKDDAKTEFITSSEGQVVLDHFPEGNFAIQEINASANYEFTAGDKVSFAVDNSHWKVGTDQYLHIANANNVPVLPAKLATKQQNTTRSMDQVSTSLTVKPGDKVKYFGEMTLPEKLSPGSYRTLMTEIEPKNNAIFNAPDYTDVVLGNKKFKDEDISIVTQGYQVAITLSENAVKSLKGNDKLSFQMLCPVAETSDLTVSTIQSDVVVNQGSAQKFPDLQSRIDASLPANAGGGDTRPTDEVPSLTAPDKTTSSDNAAQSNENSSSNYSSDNFSNFALIIGGIILLLVICLLISLVIRRIRRKEQHHGG